MSTFSFESLELSMSKAIEQKQRIYAGVLMSPLSGSVVGCGQLRDIEVITRRSVHGFPSSSCSDTSNLHIQQTIKTLYFGADSL
jgi:hypothetical protein